jgi:ceramide glucosyltransferase
VAWFDWMAAPAVVLALLSLRGERRRAAYVARRLTGTAEHLPKATVIVPVKGNDEGLRDNLAALASLDYPDYELIVTAHAAGDIPPGVLPGRVRVVLAHGDDPHTGEKVRNLQAAVRAASQRSDVLAFCDSDARPGSGWLRALTAPLAEQGVGASTGFRWFVPAAGFWPMMRSVWDAVSAGTLGPEDCGFAWGGSMAVRKQVFYDARVPEFWKDAVSDDYALSAAIHAAGLRIAYAPGALTPCYETLPVRRFFSWMRRQMVITRVYNPRLWWPALIGHVVYCAGMVASLAGSLAGHPRAGVALAAQLLPGMWKGWRRAALARSAMPQCAAWFRSFHWTHAAAVPLATWLWLIALVSSAGSSVIEWRGYRYRLKRHW